MKTPARILIISSGNPCRNPRPEKEADTLGRAGFDVTLLTPSGPPELDVLDRELTAGAPYRHEIVLVGQNRNTIFFRKCRHWLARRIVKYGMETVEALGIVSPLARRARALPADLTIVHNEIPLGRLPVIAPRPARGS